MATISIADSDARVQYTQAVTADTTQLTIDFPFFSLDDINVIVTSAAGVDTTLTRGTGTGTFAVTGTSVDDGFSGGHITLGDTYSNAATKYTIFRDITIERTTDFPTSGPFNISSLNTELDKIFAIEQELETKIGRTLKLADSDSAATLALPNLDTRKGTVLAFNTTTGLPEAGPEIGDVSSIAAITTDIATLADIEDGTDATDAIQTVAGISSDVTTVSGIEANVTTVAGISANVTAVAGDEADIGTVAGISANVTTVAGISANVTTVAGISSNVTTVAGDSADIQALAAKTTELGLLGTADAIADMNTLATSAIVTDLDLLADVKADIESLGDITADITTVAGQISPTNNISTVAGISGNITTVGGISGDVTTVAGISANTTTVAGISANVTTVAGVASNVTTVAGISSDVTTVAGKSTEIGRLGTADAVADMNTLGTAAIVSDLDTVAGISANVTTVAGVSANVTTVAGISGNVTTVAGVSSDVTTVAGISSNVTTVATNNANVTTVATNITGVNSFAERYRVASADPTTSLDEGDLAYNTTSNELKYYDGSAWNAISPGITQVSEDTTPTLGGNLDVNDKNIEFGDSSGSANNRIKFGASDDLVIFHDATHSYIQDNGTGDLRLTSNGTGVFITKGTSENMAQFRTDGAVNLYYDNSFKFATKSDGVNVIGELEADSLDIDGAADITGNVTLHANLELQDGDKILLGTGDDLEIQHSGSNSHITHSGTGALYIDSNSGTYFRNAAGTEAYASFIQDGAVDLYHNGSKKLATTSTGVTVTGTVTANSFSGDGSALTGISSVGGATGVDFNDSVKARFGTGNDLEIYHDGNSKIADVGTGKLELHSNGTGVAIQKGSTEYMAQFLTDGAVQLYYDNANKLETTSSGAVVYGWLDANEGIRHNNDTNTALTFDNDDIRLSTGGTVRLVVDTTGVTLGSTSSAKFKPVSGDYGSIEIDGGAKNTYEGVNIGGRVAFMHNNSADGGIYNDVDNAWMLYTGRQGTTRLYYNGGSRFESASGGANVYGTINAYAEGSNNFRVDLRQGSAKMWACVEQFGTHSFKDSYNTSSVTDQGTSYSFVNINNDMNNANYAISGSTDMGSYTYGQHQYNNEATSGLRVVNSPDYNKNFGDGQVGTSIHGDIA